MALRGTFGVRKQQIHQTLPSNFQQFDKVDDKGLKKVLEYYVTSTLKSKTCQILRQPALRWTAIAVIVETSGVVETGHNLIKKFTLSEDIKTLLVTFCHLCDASKRWKNSKFSRKYDVREIQCWSVDSSEDRLHVPFFQFFQETKW